MHCDECETARICNGHWMRFDSLKCHHCAARYLQAIGLQPIGKTEIAAWRTRALKASTDRGLDEKLIRSLFKAGGLIVCERPVKEATEVKETKGKKK